MIEPFLTSESDPRLPFEPVQPPKIPVEERAGPNVGRTAAKNHNRSRSVGRSILGPENSRSDNSSDGAKGKLQAGAYTPPCSCCRIVLAKDDDHGTRDECSTEAEEQPEIPGTGIWAPASQNQTEHDSQLYKDNEG